MTMQRKMGILVSMQMGILMGSTFTFMSMMRQGGIHAVQPIGILISALISMVMSGVIGAILPVKEISEKIGKKVLKKESTRSFGWKLIEALVGAVIYTPILCTFFVLKNVGIHNPMIVQILFSTMAIDFVVCIFLSLIFTQPIVRLTGKLFGVSA